MGKQTTWEKTKVLDRTKELYGPRIQANGETYYLRKTKILDGTRVLYGPRTQAYEEANYLKEKTKVLDRIKAFVRSSDSILWGNQPP